jgi:hypothetical protein
MIKLWRGDGRGMHEYMKNVGIEIVRWKILTKKKHLENLGLEGRINTKIMVVRPRHSSGG